MHIGGCGGTRDGLSRFLGLARSLRSELARTRRCVCDLYRLLAQARPRGEEPKKHHSLRGCEDRVAPKLLLPVRVSLLYERKRWPHIINIPRALFSSRTGREPRY
jgi:hypothetical protein